MSTLNVNKIADASGGVLAPISSVMRNRLINSDMRIDQRNAGASVTANTDGAYTLDRWFVGLSQSGKFSVQQDAGAVTPPAGFTDYLGVTSLSAYTVGSGDFFSIRQKIEGFNVADLGWGTANAKTVTLSFWVRSSLTGTFGGTLANSAQNRNYPFSYSISAANTWEQKSITIAGDTTGTWLTTNGTGIGLQFGLGVGSTYSGTAGAWSSSLFISATGATSVVGTNGATFYITGVQLEVGTQATSFEYRQYGTELALCQRYYWKFNSPSNAYNNFGLGVGAGSIIDRFSISNPVRMRTTPTGTGNALAIYDGSSVITVSGLGNNYSTVDVSSYSLSIASSVTAGKAVAVVANNSSTSFIDASAEL